MNQILRGSSLAGQECQEKWGIKKSIQQILAECILMPDTLFYTMGIHHWIRDKNPHKSYILDLKHKSRHVLEEQ